jgi:choline dehydrogenase-like flavoprotein
MPFIDANTSKHFNSDDYDMIIIGAGAAGILLSVKFSQKGKKVLIIESGHFIEDDQRQCLNEAEQSGKILNNIVWGRKRAIGGTTIAWGGQSLPFSPIDFEERDWVMNSGWPIGFSDLETFYKEANRFMDIDEMNYDEDIFKYLKLKKIDFTDEEIDHHFSKWAKEPNFRKLYDKELKKDVTVLYNAVVTKINVDEQGRAKQLIVKNFNFDEFYLSVNLVIIAAGAIETNRLLLNNNHQAKAGIGNYSGLLGKGFMEHPCIAVGTVHTQKAYQLQCSFNTHIKKQKKYSIRLSLSEQAQRKNKILNGSAGIMFQYKNEQVDPYLELKNMLHSKTFYQAFSRVGGVATNFESYFKSAYAYVFQNMIYKHKAEAKLVMMLEQEPTEKSCISISREKDFFGCPKASVNWQITEKTWQTAMFLSKSIQTQLGSLFLGELNLNPEMYNENQSWASLLSDVNHHMGGTRMSDTEHSGIVNKNLQLWGHENIYVCSTSVFPTGSHSNPTLTLLALACRLADRINNN